MDRENFDVIYEVLRVFKILFNFVFVNFGIKLVVFIGNFVFIFSVIFVFILGGKGVLKIVVCKSVMKLVIFVLC